MQMMQTIPQLLLEKALDLEKEAVYYMEDESQEVGKNFQNRTAENTKTKEEQEDEELKQTISTGDYVYHPMYGFGQIEGTEKADVDGNEETVYSLKFDKNTQKVKTTSAHFTKLTQSQRDFVVSNPDATDKDIKKGMAPNYYNLNYTNKVSLINTIIKQMTNINDILCSKETARNTFH